MQGVISTWSASWNGGVDSSKCLNLLKTEDPKVRISILCIIFHKGCIDVISATFRDYSNFCGHRLHVSWVCSIPDTTAGCTILSCCNFPIGCRYSCTNISWVPKSKVISGKSWYFLKLVEITGALAD